MKKKIKDNKVIIIIVIALIILSIILVKLLDNYSNESGAIYGSRLDGIEKVEITSKIKKDIIENIESTERVQKVSVNLQGKIINIEVILKDEIAREDAKPLADKVVEKLTDEQKKFYDIQIFLKKKTEDPVFPIIGYRHHNKETFSWTLDR